MLKSENKIINENMFDSIAKSILSNKQVVANLLMSTVNEYKDLSYYEVYHLIEDGSDSKIINGINTEDIGLNDGTIHYDILFTAKLPKSNEDIGLYVNIEPQSYYTHYPIVKRAIYYASRLLSRQKGIEFNGQDYQKLKKVYSIWICIPTKKEHQNTINKYTLSEQMVEGNLKIDKQDYDLIDITIFNLGKSVQIDRKDTLTLLKYLFIKTGIDSKTLSQILLRDYNIEYSEQEVEDMGTLSKGIEYLGYQEGHEKGVEEGIQQGIEQGTVTTYVKTIKSLLKAGNTIEQAVKILELDEEIKEKVLNELNKQQ